MRKLHGMMSPIITLIALLVLVIPTALATHQPADKIAVSGSTLAVARTQLGAGGSESAPITLLSAILRTSGPTDLILQHTQECTLVTNVKLSSSGSSDATAFAQEKVWVELDGNPVPVASGDDGEVVFCNRTFQIKTNILQQIQALCGFVGATCEETFFEAFLKTKSAHGFNWVALNVGAGIHTIEVKAKLTVNVSGNGEAQAIVGKRTLLVVPAKLANDAHL